MTTIDKDIRELPNRFKLSYEPDWNSFTVECPMAMDDIIKQVPGSRFNKKRGWTIPCSYVVFTQLSNIIKQSYYRPKLVLDKKAATMLKYLHQQVMDQYHAKSVLNGEIDEDTYRWNDLQELQKYGANWLSLNSGCALTDEMGSGKTVQACVALNMLEAELVLIVCPNSVKRVWEEHIVQWTNMVPIIVEGTPKQRSSTLIKAPQHLKRVALIMNWAQLRLHSNLKKFGAIHDDKNEPKELNDYVFDVIIADEAHRSKDPRAKQTRALWALEAKHRWALTGTPLANHPLDFWSILHFISPNDWPNRQAFSDRYCDTVYSPFGGYQVVGLSAGNREEFDSLIGPYMLRRQKHEIMGRKIMKKVVQRYVTLDPAHRKQYELLKNTLVLQLKDKERVTLANALAATVRLVQLASANLDVNEEKIFDPETQEEKIKYSARMVLPSPKLDEMVQLLEDLEGESVVVFSASRQLVELAAPLLAKKKISYCLVTGDTDVELRAQYAKEFNAGVYNVFLATTGASGEGISLTKAKYLIMLQRPWSMVQAVQAEDRIHRWGQESDMVTIIDVLTEDTIDERIYNIYHQKKGRLQDLTRDELIELL